MNNRIKQVRIFFKLSQTEFGKKLDKTLRMVQYYEKGERNIDDGVILRLHEAFNVNINWFRTGEGEMFLEKEQSSIEQKLINQIIQMAPDRQLWLSNYIDSLQPLDKLDKKSRGGE